VDGRRLDFASYVTSSRPRSREHVRGQEQMDDLLPVGVLDVSIDWHWIDGDTINWLRLRHRRALTLLAIHPVYPGGPISMSKESNGDASRCTVIRARLRLDTNPAYLTAETKIISEDTVSSPVRTS
jgi:hypothetical protein